MRTCDHALVAALAPRDHALALARIQVQTHPAVPDRTRIAWPRPRPADDRVRDLDAIAACVVHGDCAPPGDGLAAASDGAPVKPAPAREPNVVDVHSEAASVRAVERRRSRAPRLGGDT